MMTKQYILYSHFTVTINIHTPFTIQECAVQANKPIQRDADIHVESNWITLYTKWDLYNVYTSCLTAAGTGLAGIIQIALQHLSKGLLSVSLSNKPTQK